MDSETDEPRVWYAGVEEKEKRERAKKEGTSASGIEEWVAGREPLKDSRAERFCQAVSGGENELEAYYRCYKDECGQKRTKLSTAKSTKAKLKKKKDIRDRLAWLRRENSTKAKLGREEKLKITEEVIQGLRADFQRGERGKTVNDLMSALQRHDAMTGEGEKPVLKIELNLGGLLNGVDKLVEKRLGIASHPVEILDLPSAKDAEVVETEAGKKE